MSSVVILVCSRDVASGMRQDEYCGTFASLELGLKTALLFDNGIASTWRELVKGTGPFDSYSLYGVEPQRIFRSETTPENACWALIEIVGSDPEEPFETKRR